MSVEQINPEALLLCRDLQAPWVHRELLDCLGNLQVFHLTDF